MNAIRTIVTVELKNDLSRCSRMYVCVSIDPRGRCLRNHRAPTRCEEYSYRSSEVAATAEIMEYVCARRPPRVEAASYRVRV